MLLSPLVADYPGSSESGAPLVTLTRKPRGDHEMIITCWTALNWKEPFVVTEQLTKRHCDGGDWKAIVKIERVIFSPLRLECRLRFSRRKGNLWGREWGHTDIKFAMERSRTIQGILKLVPSVAYENLLKNMSTFPEYEVIAFGTNWLACKMHPPEQP